MSISDVALVYHVSHRFNSGLDIDRVLADVLDLTVQQVQAHNGSIIIFDEKGTVAHRILARVGMPPEQEEAVIAEVLSQGLAGWVVEHRQGSIAVDVLSDHRWISFPDDELVGGSAVCVPLLRRERIVGVLTLRHPELGHFTDAHLAMLSSIADQSVIAIENARLFHSMRVERAKMEAIINGAGDAFLVMDQGGCVVLMNPVARQAFGVAAKAELEDRHLGDLVDSPALNELWEHREGEAHPCAGEIPLPDGRTFHASITRIPDVGFTIVMQDITYLKKLDEMKNDFVSAVSHDLRSPLQLILTYAGLLSDERLRATRYQEFIDGIKGGVATMTGLINDLLDLAKIETGMGMDGQECRLDRVIVEVVGRLENLIRNKGLRIVTEIASSLPPVHANVHRIDQVISNLVDNAIKYTLEGTITVRAFADASQVTVQVADTGIGLMPQDQKGLFSKFHRVENEWTLGIEGTGLGLAIAKSIIEQYGGRIWMQSVWQEGSTFSFSLPRSDQG